jgi:hypothetical protein
MPTGKIVCFTPLILLLCLLFLSTQASAELPLFSAEYKLTRGAIPIATVKLSLKRDKDGFLFESKTEPVVPLSWIREDLVIEQSYWRYYRQSPRSDHYRYSRSNRNNAHKATVYFNWSKHELINTTNGDSWKMGLADKTIDKALVQLALMEDLARGKNDNLYNVADGGLPKSYHFLKTGEGPLLSKLGTFRTLRISRRKAGKQADTTLWMAPELSYLPIKIEKTRGNSVYSMSISKLSMPE